MPLTVRSAMSSPVVLSLNTSLRDAIVRLGYTPFGVVVDSGRVLGTIARSDLEVAREGHRQEVRRNPFLGEPRLGALVRAKVVLVGPETPLTKAATLMQTNQLPALPVVDGPKVAGVLTLRQALDHLRELWQADLRTV